MNNHIKNQLILGIDGSGNDFSVGLLQGGVALGNLYLNNGQKGSQMMLESIDQLLKTTGVLKEDLQGICVSIGPGSFTSVRISLSTAEAMGIALSVPVYGVDSLVLIAASLPYRKFPVKVIQNAYKGELYSAIYDTSSGVPMEITPVHLIAPCQFYETLKEGDFILGTGLEKLLEAPYQLHTKNIFLGSDFIHKASGIRVIEQVISQKIEPPSTTPVTPLYVRDSEAEINYQSRFKTQTP